MAAKAPESGKNTRSSSVASLLSNLARCEEEMGEVPPLPSDETGIDALSVMGAIKHMGDYPEDDENEGVTLRRRIQVETPVEVQTQKRLSQVAATGCEEYVMPSEGGARVLGIAGCTNSGKTTLSRLLMDLFIQEDQTVCIVNQDDFFYEKEQVARLVRDEHGKVVTTDGHPVNFYYDYDSKEAIDKSRMINAIYDACNSHDYVIVEGNMLTEWRDVVQICDRIIFLTINQETCRRRRSQRAYDPPDPEGYFDDVAWPAYQQHLQRALALARDDKRISFLDVSSKTDVVSDDSLLNLLHAFSDDAVRICFDPLDVDEVMRIINSPTCGATSIFVGTTRDTFNGRKVERLDYESYDEMAYKELRKLCQQTHEKFPTVERVVIFHRIGEVAVSEISVIIATSSPHRKEAIHASEFAIDELKRMVPIWKKEVYEDGGCSWKENGEWNANDRHAQPTSIEEKTFAQGKRTRDAHREVFWLRQFMRQVADATTPREKPNSIAEVVRS